MSLKEAEQSAQLKPAFFIHLDAQEPEFIYDNESESMVYVEVTGGYTKTLDPKYPFDTEVLHGIDNLRASKATPGTATLDCQLYLKSKDNGSKIHFVYSGVSTPDETQNDVVANKSKIQQFTQGYLTNHPSAVLDSKATVEKWITTKNLIGKGRFIRDEKTGKLGVEYYVYVLE